MKLSRGRLVASLLVPALAASAALAQRSPDISIGTRAGIARYELSLPAFTGDAATDQALRAIIRDDLAFSGLFDLVAEGAPAKNSLTGTIEAAGDQFVVTVSLQETSEGHVLMARRLRGSSANLRRVGHRIADDVVQTFTGTPGSFDTRIAYVSQHGTKSDIWVMDYDGQSPVRVTADEALVLSPKVSADGQRLLFTSYASGQPAVYAIQRETGQVQRLFRREGLNQAAAFAPDGEHIALSASFEGNSEIYAADLSGAHLRRLTNHPSIDVSPAWSPNGKEIAFVSDRGGNPQVYVMTADGLDVRRVSLAGEYNTDPAWSPDGTKLAYSTRQQGRFQVAVLDLAGGAVQLLTDASGNSEHPIWSPGGEFLAFMSSREGGYDIWIMRADGTGQHRVGTGGGNRFPFWYR